MKLIYKTVANNFNAIYNVTSYYIINFYW